MASPGMASTSPLPAQPPTRSLHPLSLIPKFRPLTLLTAHIMCAIRLGENCAMRHREGIVHTAFGRDLMGPFEHRVDSWKETLFRKHSYLVACPEVQ